MGLFRDRWDSENYPSYEDYLEAKRNGTLDKNRAYVNTPTSSERKANLSSPAPRVAESKDHSLESQTASIEAKTRAASVITKAADAKRFRDTSSQYGEPKPFAGRLPNVPGDKKKQFKGIAILIAILIGVLPSFTKLLDTISEDLNLGAWIESLGSQEISPDMQTETATAEAVEIISNITTALPADHFVIDNPTGAEKSNFSGIVENIILEDATTILFGRDANEIPFLELQLDSGSLFPLANSKFMNAVEHNTYFNEAGTLLDTAYIEFVFTDLTNDGYKELLIYYYSEDAYPAIEVFYNTGSDTETYKALDFFESYTNLNITSEGIIQRLTVEGELYDEIEVTADGVYPVKN